MKFPNCPLCKSEFTYEDGNLFMCPECGHEWSNQTVQEETETKTWKDSVGNTLSNGDMVTVIKDLKFKGSSSAIKVGTKVKNIRLIDGDHDIDCKVEGFGSIQLKSEFVRKA